MNAALPQLVPQAAGASSQGRLGPALCLAIAAHLALILGVGFSLQPPSQPSKTLEITLATFKSDKKPEEADFIAQENQQGSGTQEKKTAPRTNQQALFQDNEIRKVTPPAAPPEAIKPEPSRTVVTSQARQRDKVPIEPAQAHPKQASRPAPIFDSSRLSAEISSLEAELAQDIERYAKRPRVSRQNSAATMRDISAWYRDEWRKKVERIGNLNYPEEARRNQIYGHLRLLVTVNRDGTVAELQILESSGKPVLDSAAIRIVRLAAPFAPFIGELAKRYDQVEIIRTWRFEGGDRLSSK
ncbi:energy transducer TonB [Azomonas macrocytogenes]|nr:energy transducer TonB [Azomonas macrocytogenes]